MIDHVQRYFSEAWKEILIIDQDLNATYVTISTYVVFIAERVKAWRFVRMAAITRCSFINGHYYRLLSPKQKAVQLIPFNLSPATPATRRTVLTSSQQLRGG